jgi:hypothetical protein
MLEPSNPDARSPLKRGWIFAGALLLTAMACAFAFWLGAWGFDFRRYSQHEGRLRRLVLQEPTRDRVERGLADEGSPLIEAPEGPAALEKLARSLGGRKAAEVLTKGRRWPTTRVFRAGDMLYFLYFDHDDVLRDYTCVSA